MLWKIFLLIFRGGFRRELIQANMVVIEPVDQGAYEYEVRKKARLDLSFLSETDIQKFDDLLKRVKEPNFIVKIVDGLRKWS